MFYILATDPVLVHPVENALWFRNH